MQPIHLAWVDYTILFAYVAFVVGIGFALTRYMKTFVGLPHVRPLHPDLGHRPGLHLRQPRRAGTGRHGRQRRQIRHRHRHFYWVGAIPAMIFLAVFMMPFYYGSKARSVPEYLQDALRRARCAA